MAGVPQDSSTPPAAGTGASGPTESNAYSMFKSFSAKTALFVSNASKRTAETVKSGTKSGTQGLMTLGTSASEGIKHLSTAGSQYVWNATGNVVGRFSQAGLVPLCQREAKEAPCPRIMLLCCTAICSGALASEGLFTQDGPHDLVDHLQREVQASHAASLLPPGTSPQVIASLIKHWLCSLPEPLMTFKLVPALTSASTPVTALKSILAELPLANSNALHLLLDTCNRIASNAAINDTDATALANALAPCLLWKEARPATAAPPSSTPDMDAPISPTSPVAPVQGTPLSEEELQVLKQLLVHIITNYRSFC